LKSVDQHETRCGRAATGWYFLGDNCPVASPGYGPALRQPDVMHSKDKERHL